METYNLIDRFFEIHNSSILHLTVGVATILETCDEAKIKQILPDGKPFLFMQKAVIYEHETKNLAVLSLSYIGESDCEGHYEDERMVPLIHFCRALALTGRLLGAKAAGRGNEKMSPEVIEFNGGRSLLSEIRYAKPPVKVISFVKLIGEERITIIKEHLNSDGTSTEITRGVDTLKMYSRCWIYVPEEKKYVPAGEMKELYYVPLSYRAVKRGLRAVRTGGNINS
jgi:hypothetical protein